MGITPVDKIAEAVSNVASAFTEWFKKVDVRHIIKDNARLRKAVDRADMFIKRYEELTPTEKRDTILRKYIRDFYDILT